jgi:hypothetical protein
MINLLLTYMNSELQPQKVMPQVMALGRTMTWWTSLLQAGQQTNFLLRILAAGPIPKHIAIAFIMDGN